ncbi:retinol dehydrogenase 12-like [Chrysoperla carnea]|uniref:retinol dehydrogenase 12-like n=1 Tax=Chrysoperla carnea TaxID=189513 RepID=UPI001D05E129|nr:retinol dehydrogenase 12-like [Chrysoperla carnea]
MLNSKSDFNLFEADPFSWWLPYIVAAFVGIITIIREYIGGCECPSRREICNKVVLITGGSGGIAYETALELAKRGGIVILACKNIEKGQSTRDKILKVLPTAIIFVKKLDVSCMASIKNFIENEFRYRRVDVLINNAGISEHPFQLTEEGHEIHLATNYLGHFYLTHLLIPRLTAAGNARVINVIDKVYKNVELHLKDLNITTNWSCQEAYAHSKLCLVLMTKQIAKLLQGYKITINAVTPGSVRNTGFLRNSPMCKNTLLKIWFYPCLWLFYRNPKQGAQSIIFSVVDANLEKVSGVLISNCEIEKNSKKPQEDKLSEELYLKTCELLDISPINPKKH